MEVVKYPLEQVITFREACSKFCFNYRRRKLPFEEFKKAHKLLAKDGKEFDVDPVDYSKPVNIAPTTAQLLAICDAHKKEFDDIEINASPIEKAGLINKLCKSIFKPAQVLHVQAPIMLGSTDGIEDIPVWYDSSESGINLRFGYLNGDKSLITATRLADTGAHMLGGGNTGSGKSVLLNVLITNLLLEYAPWEIELYLADFKIVEFSPYGNRVPTPHVKMIAATSSTEFTMSMFNELTTELSNRERLFARAGVKDLAHFRKAFNLILPRIVLIADEYMELFVNIAKSQELGNDHADEDKELINSRISSIARLGRAFGLHMLLVSQDLTGGLDDSIKAQFTNGVTLQANASISKTLIGNDAGTTLREYGKGIVNTQTQTKDSSLNKLYRIPAISDEIPENVPASEAISEEQRYLILLYKLSQKYGYSKDFVFYNEDDKEPIIQLQKGIKLAVAEAENPVGNTPAETAVLKEKLRFLLPLGAEVRCSREPFYMLPLRYERNSHIIVDATKTADRIYMLKLLAEDFSGYKTAHFLLNWNTAWTTELNLVEKLHPREYHKQTIPDEIFGWFNLRQSILNIQAHVYDNLHGSVTQAQVVEYCILETAKRLKLTATPEMLEILQPLFLYSFEKHAALQSAQFNELHAIRNLAADLQNDVWSLYVNAIQVALGYNTCSKNCTIPVTPRAFSTRVVWCIGLDESTLPLVENYNILTNFVAMLPRMSECGIFFIFTASSWDKLSKVAKCCNYVLERSTRDFFDSIELRKYININNNSFQIHDLKERQRHIIRMYSI